MDELHTGSKHPLSGADHESYFDLHMVLPGYQPRREGDCMYLAQYNQAYSWQVALVGLGWLPNQEKGPPIINPQAGETCLPRLATHVGEGNSEFKPMAKAPSWHCPSLL